MGWSSKLSLEAYEALFDPLSKELAAMARWFA